MNNFYKGKILISSPDVSGDIFSRSVVIVIEHNEDGAFGLILNKKNKMLSENLQDIFGLPVEAYEGGPVGNDKTFFIVKGKPVNDFFIELDDNFYLTEDIETIVTEFVNGRLAISDMKVFSGYSGWGVQQLDAEVAQKFWTVVDSYNLDYTSVNNETLWKNIMENLGGEYLLWANAPEDVSLN